MSSNETFDEFVQNYDDALERGLSVSGDSKLDFAAGRIRWLAGSLSERNNHPRRVLDFGCGIGDSSAMLLEILGASEYLGVDSSPKSIHHANLKHGSAGCRFAVVDSTPAECDHFDLAYSNGVFHHISVGDRPSAAKYVYRSLRSGGIFAFWENNPWNPGTQYVMSRIPFDRDAKTLSVITASRLLTDAGFRILRREFLFIFPRVLKYLRFLEPGLSAMPIGAQYQILCQRP
jgi:SAM-dependent methyltransferase